MSNSFSLERLSQYLAENVEKIRAVRNEVEEVQVGFNSAYVEWKAPHDATLSQLVDLIVPRLDGLGPELGSLVERRIEEERAIVSERRAELETTLIPEGRTEADQLVLAGQQLAEELRATNPRLDREEEEYKAKRVELKKELESLNREIRRRSGCLRLK